MGEESRLLKGSKRLAFVAARAWFMNLAILSIDSS